MKKPKPEEKKERAKPVEKPVVWMGNSRRELREFPEEVRYEVGQAIFAAQQGSKHLSAKPMTGFGGASVLEITSDFDTDTYRAVYTVKFKGRIYVLHAFQKKSKKGIETPKADLDLIKERLKAAQEHFESTQDEDEE